MIIGFALFLSLCRIIVINKKKSRTFCLKNCTLFTIFLLMHSWLLHKMVCIYVLCGLEVRNSTLNFDISSGSFFTYFVLPYCFLRNIHCFLFYLWHGCWTVLVNFEAVAWFIASSFTIVWLGSFCVISICNV